MASKTVERMKKKLLADKPPAGRPDFKMGLSTGLTLLNLGLTSRPGVGLFPSMYYMLVGDSQAGKTMAALQMLAEASINSHYDNYRLIYDPTERGALMDVRKFFGGRLADRLEPPTKKGASRTLNQFYDNVTTAVKEGRPFMYVLDSEDALKTEAGSKGKEYGTDKAMMNSSEMRGAHNGLDETKPGSILIVVKQSRVNIGNPFNPKTRSGGQALTYYATSEIWFSLGGAIKSKVLGKEREIGSYLVMHVKKNRENGRHHRIRVPFYPGLGMDDVGSCVDFMMEEKRWKPAKGKDGGDDDKDTSKAKTVIAPEFNFEGPKEKLIEQIEEQDKVKELRLLVSQVWSEIEAACEVNRKPRYE